MSDDLLILVHTKNCMAPQQLVTMNVPVSADVIMFQKALLLHSGGSKTDKLQHRMSVAGQALTPAYTSPTAALCE